MSFSTLTTDASTARDFPDSDFDDAAFDGFNESAVFDDLGDFPLEDNANNGFLFHDSPSSERRALATGFSWNKTKIIRMLSSRSLMQETQDDDLLYAKGGDFCLSDDISVVHSVGTYQSEYTSASFSTQKSEQTTATFASDFSESIATSLTAKLEDPDDHDSSLAAELEQLPEAELQSRFLAMKKTLKKRRKQFRKSRTKRRGVGKRDSLKLGSIDDSTSNSNHKESKRSSRRSHKVADAPEQEDKRKSRRGGLQRA